MNRVRIVRLRHDLLPNQVLNRPQNQRILHDLVVHVLLLICLQPATLLARQVDTPIGLPLHTLYILGIVQHPLVVFTNHVDCLLH